MTDVMTAAGISTTKYRAEADQQTLLFWYPAVTSAPDDYIQSAVKIEAGAKSALDPNVPTTVHPYVAEDLTDFDLKVTGIRTAEPQCTFWDKVVILHGSAPGTIAAANCAHAGQRVSRHYFDVFRLLQSPFGETAQADRALGVDCARHARMFFNNPHFHLYPIMNCNDRQLRQRMPATCIPSFDLGCHRPFMVTLRSSASHASNAPGSSSRRVTGITGPVRHGSWPIAFAFTHAGACRRPERGGERSSPRCRHSSPC